MKSPWPLMENNITAGDLDVLIDFLKGNPILTQSSQVAAFEREWSEWLGVKHSVFVNSGSSANILTLAALLHCRGSGEVILAPFGWVSDIVAVMANDFKPIFADINPRTLSLDTDQVIARITPRTRAVLMVHAQGFHGLTDRLLDVLKEKDISLIEDVCESHGATFREKKCGSFGLVSNFSYYFAHHMSTIEGGMVCTNDDELYQTVRMLRSHGMVRESTDEKLKERYAKRHPDLNPDFIFAFPGYNMRNTEIGAVIGRNQLKRLDGNNEKRRKNFKLFVDQLDPEKYWTDFDFEGSCNYAFNLVMRKPDKEFCDRVIKTLRNHKIEFRRGSAGGGNQLRQPYLHSPMPNELATRYPVVDHVHFFGMYLGNYPSLAERDILDLCALLNSIPAD